MDSSSKFQKNPDVVARRLAEGEGGVLLHLSTGAYHGMNEIGLMIWELIDGQRTAVDLSAAMRSNIDGGGPPQLDDDVELFLKDAVERNLVVLV